MRGKEVYFHVGLGKVASTFLQQKVFPNLANIQYISTGKYRSAKKIIAKSKTEKVLVSREFDRQLEQEVAWFSKDFPQAKVIILLRRQDEWAASQYRRKVKNGWYGSFEEFLDLEHDQGLWKQSDFAFAPKVDFIRRHSGQEPLVLIYDDLVARPEWFLQRLCGYMGVETPVVHWKKVHTSFSDKQLKVLQAFCKRYVKSVPKGKEKKLLHWLTYRPVWAFYHLVLYLAVLIPDSWVSKAPLISEESLKKVRKFYAEDWEAVKD
ncbi:MAG: hypothetical protein RIC35_12015 [Marinoscillum sp.]